MKILILSGPAGVGKNTIAHIISKQIKNIAVIDVDVVRWMLLNPHKAPWEGEEGHFQHTLGIENTCLVANNFIRNNFNVIILDIVSDERIKQYRELLIHNPKFALLLPSFDEMKRRNGTREHRLTEKELERVFKEQKEVNTYDERIDNTSLTAEEVASNLLPYFS